MKQVKVNGVVVEYNTQQELADAIAALQLVCAPAKRQPKAGQPKKGTGKKAPQPKAEMVEFTKKNGETVLVTAAQAKAWEAYRSHSSGKTLDEVKALQPEITDAGREYVKAHPLCTRKEAAANGCKNITKEGLKALKVELGVHTAK
jgi:hypothetical protein